MSESELEDELELLELDELELVSEPELELESVSWNIYEGGGGLGFRVLKFILVLVLVLT